MTSWIAPGKTLGILGGGQLGRMTAMAARSMGYSVHVLDPDPECAAAPVVDQLFTARFDDAQAAAALARGCQAVTLEIEKISLESLDAAAALAPLRPGRSVLEIIQDKGRQKSWLSAQGFPVGPFQWAPTLEALKLAQAKLGPSTFIKGCTGGYDGRGQVKASATTSVEETWKLLGSSPCVVESALELDAELSVLVARNPSGMVAVYPPSWNHHENQILDWCLLPAPQPSKLLREAESLGRAIAEALQLEGILAIELFLTRDGKLWVNELAPRPHNSFHSTELSCATSQFEQLVRAVTNLPLGSVEVVRPTAVANLLGDLWLHSHPPRFDLALSIPGTRLHLYGKKEARAGRKMGHLSAIGATGEEALTRVKQARDLLV